MSFLDWWVPLDSLEAGTENWSVLANHSVSAWRAVGGKLVATETRLVFYPNRVDKKLGGKVWSVPLSSLGSIGRKSPTGAPFNGGLRSRLRIVTDDGAEHLFVVNELGSVVDRLQQLLPQ